MKRPRRIVASLTLLLSLLLPIELAASAQIETFDLATYTAPSGAGWTRQQNTTVVTFTTIDQRAGIYLMISVYDSQPSRGSSEADFAAEWQSIVQTNFTAPGSTTPVRHETGTGLTFWEGGTAARAQEPLYAHLYMFPLDTRVQSVLVTTSSTASFASYRPQVQAFLNGLRFRTPSPTTGAAAPTADSSAAARPPLTAGKGVSGLWYASTTGAVKYRATEMGFQYDAVARKMEWKTFFADGQAFDGLPREGLFELDQARSKNDPLESYRWGSYTFAGGGTGWFRREPIQDPITQVSEVEIRIGKFTYFRPFPVDGLRLQGAWSYMDPNDPYLAEPGCRQIILFTREGRFDDRGAFVSDCRTPDREPENGPGSGSYEVEAHSLILRYATGRVKKVSLCGALNIDPKTDDRMLYIGGQPFFKRAS